MTRQKTDSRLQSKRTALTGNGTYNHSARQITDPLFATEGGFFDPHDLVQVKYEMLRRVRVEKLAVTHAAAAFGFSRVSYYQTLHAFRQHGIGGLLPRQHGPKRAHKLGDEVMDAVMAYQQENPDLTPEDIVLMLQREFDLHVHVRSLQRAIARRKKNG